jgi:hypothetical protein
MAEPIGDSKPKIEQHNAIVIASGGPEKAINIDELNEIDEEEQYAIANHQSYLDPLSTDSWLLYGMILDPIPSIAII